MKKDQIKMLKAIGLKQTNRGHKIWLKPTEMSTEKAYSLMSQTNLLMVDLERNGFSLETIK